MIPETTKLRWIIRNDLGAVVCAIYAASKNEALDIFCWPSLWRDAYFSQKGGWTCEAYP